MRKKNFYQSFNEGVDAAYNEIKRKYLDDISKANEDGKTLVKNSLLQELCRRYSEVQNQLGVNSHFLFKIKDDQNIDSTRSIEEVFNERIKLITRDIRIEVLEQLVLMKALENFILTLQKDIEFTSTVCPTGIRSKVKWLGRDLEFVQLIYALKESGRLKNEKYEITSLVEEMAFLLNYELGEFWQSNLSDCIHNRNVDYQPPIFKDLLDAFNNIRQKTVEKRKRNTLK